MKRRKHHIETLEADTDEARRLLQVGYDRAGNWSLGQNCNHLAEAVDLTLSGFGQRLPRWLQRGFIFVFFRLVPLGAIGNLLGLRLPTSRPQKEPVDDAVGVERLEAAISRLQQARADHLIRFHLWHCNHHLSFLIPRDGGPQS